MNRVFLDKPIATFCLSLIVGCATATESPMIEGSAVTSRTALLEALQPPKRQRPVIAIIGLNDGTETTDYLIPYGVLSRANVADVHALGTHPGPIQMMPALAIQPDLSSEQFDAAHPRGADFVIVPAMHNDNEPTTIAWIQRQAERGAIIIGICTGAKVLGNAGLLNDRKATTHWYDLKKVQRANPSMQYVAGKRYLVDRDRAFLWPCLWLWRQVQLPSL